MKLRSILNQIIFERINLSVGHDYEDVKLFYDTMKTTPDKEAYDISYKNMHGKTNPFPKRTWAYYKWYTFYPNTTDSRDPNYEFLAKKNISIRKRVANQAEKIHPDIYVNPGDDDI